MATSWRDAPFCAHVTGLLSFAQTDLPFVLAGATQQGLGHRAQNQNNQDGIGVLIETERVCGFVADGCSGTDASLASEFSNNEVGAKITCWLLSRIVKQLDVEPSDSDGAREIVALLSERYLSGLMGIVTSIGGGELTDTILRDCFTTTVLGFIVWKQHYVVFRLGDGLCVVNGSSVGESEAGCYASSALLSTDVPGEKPCLQLVQDGSTSELDSIVLATDGISDHSSLPGELVKITAEQRRAGWAYIVPGFRVGVLKHMTAPWPDDDASFLVLGRISDAPIVNEADHAED